MMLMDLEKWRNKKIGQKVISYVRSNIGKSTMAFTDE
jgi:hypothetical protein